VTNRRVFVTGLRGFVGRHIIAELHRNGVSEIRGCGRGPLDAPLRNSISRFVQLDLSTAVDLAEHLEGCDSVIHLAGRAHIMREKESDPLSEYRKVNVDGTRLLARAAKQAGVTKFIYLSSIKVNGERTEANPFTADDMPAPSDPYGISKLESENVLADELGGSAVQYVVLRPPLIYGPGVRANFLSLMRAIHRGVPLPLGSVVNRRSMIAIANVTSAILASIASDARPSGRYVISDDEALSIGDVIRCVARGLEVEPNLVNAPPFVLRSIERILGLVGKRAMLQRLTQDLQVDSAAFKRDFGWAPQVSAQVGLKETGAWYIQQLRR
jgi:nucleoside-diphosphate-sugar epimerase